ncbi:hypothetical protein CCICO_05690 [Corynebacterium ciconiae DSM 44920]|uniref:hypothetical protein n=1 Tax=Corynebacterium ciconiae TaxID=227319 RepID=UPI00035F97A1|nr:hypothetical protein [Corynebacterium ciconiae]WKD61166.1 hypothetical protein CCICO_05690 [Corynebacterium ciconiae DSM 44920]
MAEFDQNIALGRELFGDTLDSYARTAAEMFQAWGQDFDDHNLHALDAILLRAYGLDTDYPHRVLGAVGMPVPEEAEYVAMLLGHALVATGEWEWAIVWAPPKIPGEITFTYCLAREDHEQLLFPGSWVKLAVFGTAPEEPMEAAPGLAWALGSARDYL